MADFKFVAIPATASASDALGCARQRNVRPDIHHWSKDLSNLRSVLNHLMGEVQNERKDYGMQNDRGIEITRLNRISPVSVAKKRRQDVVWLPRSGEITRR